MLTEEQRARILELHKKGLSKNRTAKELGVSWDTVNSRLHSGKSFYYSRIHALFG